jgi:hypothetical protein
LGLRYICRVPHLLFLLFFDNFLFRGGLIRGGLFRGGLFRGGLRGGLFRGGLFGDGLLNGRLFRSRIQSYLGIVRRVFCGSCGFVGWHFLLCFCFSDRVFYRTWILGWSSICHKIICCSDFDIAFRFGWSVFYCNGLHGIARILVFLIRFNRLPCSSRVFRCWVSRSCLTFSLSFRFWLVWVTIFSSWRVVSLFRRHFSHSVWL